MTDLERILDTAEEWSRRGLDFAVATVVGVRGSTYRGLAARQLVGGDGTSVGTVSGGCLDQDLHREAASVMEAGTPRMVEFDLTADDEAVWGWGIGCNGATELVLEPPEAVLAFARDLRGTPRPAVVVHHLEPDRLGQKAIVRPGEGGPFQSVAVQALEDGWNRVVETEEGRVMVEVLGAPRRLVVCGAGHDATPVVRFGAELGYEPIVVDDRRAFLTGERFPEAAELVQVAPAELGDVVELDATASVVIMSHNYLRDLDYLGAVLGRNVAYIGVLGPGARLERLLGDLAERGVRPEPHDLAVLHGPAGLDIGSEGPKEIAWAIMSEILAVRRRRPGGFLRDRKGPEELRDYDRLRTTPATGDPA
ncbi:MAG: XdhC family protein [Actinomycetota bacterium]